MQNGSNRLHVAVFFYSGRSSFGDFRGSFDAGYRRRRASDDLFEREGAAVELDVNSALAPNGRVDYPKWPCVFSGPAAAHHG
jgi:hypothetical protein